MRKVYVNVTVKLTLRCDDDAVLPDVMDELDYTFNDTSGKADVEDTEILDYAITDAK